MTRKVAREPWWWLDGDVWDCYECKTSNVGAVAEDAICPNCGASCYEAGIIRNRKDEV